MLKQFPVKGGRSDTIIPTKKLQTRVFIIKNISFYILVSTVKYTMKKLLAIAIIHVLKVLYAWDQADIYKAG